MVRCLVISVLFVANGFASNIYVAQSSAGGNTGSDCADAYAVTYFNTSGNWGMGNPITAGTTVHLCGTFTGIAGATMLTAYGSGSNGNPIIIKFEVGTVLTSPAWNNTNGAIFLNGQI